MRLDPPPSDEGPNFSVRGVRPDDSMDAEQQQGRMDQLSLFKGGEAALCPRGDGEAGSRSAPVGERQAPTASEGNRALESDASMEEVPCPTTLRRTAGYGTVRPVVWGDGGREPPSHPILVSVVPECTKKSSPGGRVTGSGGREGTAYVMTTTLLRNRA